MSLATRKKTALSNHHVSARMGSLAPCFFLDSTSYCPAASQRNSCAAYSQWKSMTFRHRGESDDMDDYGAPGGATEAVDKEELQKKFSECHHGSLY